MGLFIKRLIKIICSTIIITCATFFIINLYTSPKLNLSMLDNKSSSFIYDNSDNLIYTVGNIITDNVKYKDISKHAIDALVSTEDKRFYIHNGIDLKRIFSSSIENIKSKKFKEGASTITQQLIKNIYLSNDKTISRKIKEMYLAYKLEKTLSKEEILEKYLNNVLFGKRIYGIESASLSFFNKHAKDLDIFESSVLISLIQLPNYYLNNLDKLNERKNLVLKNMYENNYINENEYNLAKNKKIDSLESRIYNNSKYLSYVDIVLDELNNLDINPYKKSYKIYTNLDINIQNNVNEVIKNANLGNIKSSVVCLSNDGKIEAIGNSSDVGINYSKIPLQPGSTIKPLLDYAPAFEYLGYSPSSIILDDEMRYSNGQKVKNFDSSYLGEISLREALRFSRNIPSIKLFKKLGLRSFEFSKNIGINLNEDFHESMAIGGFSKGYSPLEMANAYLSFSNMGYYKKAMAIRKIDDIIYENEFKRVMSNETSYFINSILHDVIKNSKYNIKNNYMCAKTGQSNFDYQTRIKNNIPSYGIKDSWYIGYNDKKIIASWVGYDNNKYYLTPQTKDLSRIIFKNIFEKYNIKSNPFKCPKTISKCRYYYDGDYYFDDEFNISQKKRYDYFYNHSLPKDKWLSY